ncbi:MAG TPA: hypothetical protein VMR98_03450 [Candidatus Polarisedimenticolaceae bacterium]|nr:hypothetical protein [Candidatus Polarisedimenticolaceae bacterium]
MRLIAASGVKPRVPTLFILTAVLGLAVCWAGSDTPIASARAAAPLPARIDHCPPRPCEVQPRYQPHFKSPAYGRAIQDGTKVHMKCWKAGDRVVRRIHRTPTDSTIWVWLTRGGYVNSNFLRGPYDRVAPCPQEISSMTVEAAGAAARGTITCFSPCNLYQRFSPRLNAGQFGKSLKSGQKVWVACFIQGDILWASVPGKGTTVSAGWFRLKRGGYVPQPYVLLAKGNSTIQRCREPTPPI